MDTLIYIIAGLLVVLSVGIWLDHLMEFILTSGPRDTRWIVRSFLLLTVVILLLLNGFFVIVNNRAKDQQLKATRTEFNIKLNYLKDQLSGLSQNGRRAFQEQQHFNSSLFTNPKVEPALQHAVLDEAANWQSLYGGITNLNGWVKEWRIVQPPPLAQ